MSLSLEEQKAAEAYIKLENCIKKLEVIWVLLLDKPRNEIDDEWLEGTSLILQEIRYDLEKDVKAFFPGSGEAKENIAKLRAERHEAA